MTIAVEATFEEYTPERRAELLLNNAIDEADYQDAVAEVRRMGLDPASIPHRKPATREYATTEESVTTRKTIEAGSS